MKQKLYIFLAFSFICISTQAFSSTVEKMGDFKIHEVVQLAQSGDIDAQYIIGRSVLFKEIDFPDPELALRWLDNASHRNPEFAYWIGLAYDNNIKEAEKWYLKAAQLGIHKAYINLGQLFMSSKEALQNYAKAKTYFEKALSFDQIHANAFLGYMYMKGLGVRQNLTTAEIYLTRAISHQDPLGFYYMGLLEQYHTQDPNIQKAIGLYLTAAQTGDISANLEIVKTYLKNPDQTGLTQEEALFWAFLLKQWGGKLKPKSFSSLSQGLSQDQIAKIKRKAEAKFIGLSS